MFELSLLILASSLASNLVHAAPPSICHVLTYSGSCGNLTSLAGEASNSSSSSPSSLDCTFASTCLVPSICNATMSTGSIDALTGDAVLGNQTLSSNTTGCVSFPDFGMQLDSLAICDGNRYLINGTDSAYQCICNDSTGSCPEQGTAVSVSYANGTSSTSAAASGQPSQFSWTWGASRASSTPTPSASSGMNASASTTPTARTTFTFTFGANQTSATGRSSSTGGIEAVPQASQNNGASGAANKLTACLTNLAVAAFFLLSSLLL